MAIPGPSFLTRRSDGVRIRSLSARGGSARLTDSCSAVSRQLWSHTPIAALRLCAKPVEATCEIVGLQFSVSYSHQHGLRFRIQLDTVGRLFATDTALFETAEGQRRIDQVMAVHPNSPGFDALRQAMREAEVLCPHTGSQTVDGIVRLRGDFVRIRVAVGDKHGPEDFCFVQSRRRTTVLEDGGLDKVSLVTVSAAAGDHFPALADPFLDVSEYALVLFSAH